LAQM